jgi:hypothetical protein
MAGMKNCGISAVGIALLLVIGCSAGDTPPSKTASQSNPPSATAEALPLLSITTDSGADVTSKEVYVPARYVLKDASRTVLIEGGTEIRGRGNSTWDLPKKPYHLKLTTSSSLLDMPANRHWVLLANYADKTLLRNELAFQLSRSMGMEYTPRSKAVEVELNGVYQGVYQLTEHIRIAPNRVNIPELKVGDTNITGGYLIEIDGRRGEVFCWNSPRSGMPFCFKNPETLLDAGWEAHRAYIEQYLTQTEEAIFSSNFADPVTGYAAYLDVDSVIQYFLVNELAKTVDGALDRSAFPSTFLYKKRDGKLFFGPAWDFDIAFGNVPQAWGALDPEGWYIREASWFTRLFQDPAFAARVTAKWNEWKANGYQQELLRYFDTQAVYLNRVQVQNFERWDILSIQVWPFPTLVTGSYQGEVTAVKAWLRARMTWMDAQFNP